MADTLFSKANIQYGDFVTLITQICITCGVPFAIPKQLDDRLQQTHNLFYCPNGHQQCYTSKSEVEKVREQAEKDKAELARQLASEQSSKNFWKQLSEKETRKNISLKGQKTRIVNRIKKGYCPCCNQQFADLHAHMTEKHPDTI